MAKKLLKESTIRRFQKLANVAPINEMYHKRDDLMEEEEAEMDLGAEDEAPESAMGAGEDEAPEMKMGAGEDEAPETEGDLELTEEEAESIVALADKLAAKLSEMEDMKNRDEEQAEMDMEDEEEMDEEELMEALRGISYVPSRGEVVNEVAKRVARRLKQAKLHEAKLNRALGTRRR